MAKARPAHTESGPLEWLLHSLHHLGWAGAGSARRHLSAARGLPGGASVAMLSLPDGQPFAAIEPAHELPPASQSFEAYEDLADEHRQFARALEKLGVEPRYVLVLSPSGRTQLVDWPAEEVLLAMDSRGEASDRLLPLLETGAVMRGSLVSHPRKSVARRAHELERWTHLWETRVGSSLELKRGPVERFFRAMHMARLASRTGFAAPGAFDDFGAPGKRPYAAKKLRPLWKRLCGPLEFIQSVRADELEGISAAAESNGILGECLASYSRLGSTKFTSEVFSEAFADEELRTLTWREAMLAPASPPEERRMGRRAIEPTAIDLDESGLLVMLRTFDAAAEKFRKLRGELSFSQRHGEIPGIQMEVFAPEPAIPGEADVGNFALERGIRVTSSRRPRADLASMLLLCRAAEWASHAPSRPDRFGKPAVEFVPPAIVRKESPRSFAPPDPSAN